MRNVVKFLLTLVIGIALIWVGFWWYAESRLQSGFADWADRQATAGWKISYDRVARGTSILDAAVTIDNLTLDLPPGPNGAQAAISLAAVTLRIHAFDPLVFHTDLPDRIGITLGNSLSLVVSTGSIALAENLDPGALFNHSADPFRGGDFSAADIDILATGGSLLVLHIDNIASHAEVNLNAGPASTAIFTTTSVDGVAVSPLLARLASIPFDGKLAHLDLATKLTGPVPATLPHLLDSLSTGTPDFQAQRQLMIPVIHQWAAQGGSGNAKAHIDIGPSTVAAAGTIAFDANIQPNGTADLTADHLDQFTAALTNSYPSLQADVSQIEARLSQYLGNSAQGGQTLTVHAAYGKPGVFIDGQKTGDMPVLDWNAAVNPPAPAPAPGSTQ